MSDIKLSPKHGVNPSCLICPLCAGGTSIALMGKLKGDIEAPREQLDRGPCDKCILDLDQYKAMGFLFLIVDDRFEELSEKERSQVSPWQFFKRLLVVKNDSPVLKHLVENGIDTSIGAVWMPDKAAINLGLINPKKEG